MNADAPIVLFVITIPSIALFTYLCVSAWLSSRRSEREAYYRSETLQKIAVSPEGGATSAIQFLHEQQNYAARKRREGLQLGGLITTAIGVGLMIFLRAMVHHAPVYSVALIPLLIGLVILVYSYLLVPKQPVT